MCEKGYSKWALLRTLLFCSSLSISSAYPAASLVRIKRGDMEMAGMSFREDYSSAPGSGGGAMGPVYICGYAGSSPEDFKHGASKGNAGQAQPQGKSSASATDPKSLPNPKTAHSETKPKTAVPKSDRNESSYYLRPHILHMPKDSESALT